MEIQGVWRVDVTDIKACRRETQDPDNEYVCGNRFILEGLAENFCSASCHCSFEHAFIVDPFLCLYLHCVEDVDVGSWEAISVVIL